MDEHGTGEPTQPYGAPQTYGGTPEVLDSAAPGASVLPGYDPAGPNGQAGRRPRPPHRDRRRGRRRCAAGVRRGVRGLVAAEPDGPGPRAGPAGRHRRDGRGRPRPVGGPEGRAAQPPAQAAGLLRAAGLRRHVPGLGRAHAVRGGRLRHRLERRPGLRPRRAALAGQPGRGRRGAERAEVVTRRRGPGRPGEGRRSRRRGDGQAAGARVARPRVRGQGRVPRRDAGLPDGRDPGRHGGREGARSRTTRTSPPTPPRWAPRRS